ncbi:DUF2024 family protein [Pseudomonas chlororaphis]|uniref:DUF2024 family protein n=1 Tax=Pseudomonas chlororaphis TaxID=587753 RepID=UPI001B331190|nr:DUF2024 family protein [Pseudomonas chlororaphis]MBP5073688.1 DUF2024 family protein [Pseudomonas chlororaphis]
MNVKVFDTHVRTHAGHYLHFDVLTETHDTALARQYAFAWLDSLGVQESDISQNECRFCHSQIGDPRVMQGIARQGYFIIPLQGFATAGFEATGLEVSG